MKKHLYLLPLAGLLLASGTAFAAETMNGVVARADPNTGQLMLLGGANFQVTDPSVLRHLAPGQHVIVTRNNNDTIGVQVDNAYAGSGSSN